MKWSGLDDSLDFSSTDKTLNAIKVSLIRSEVRKGILWCAVALAVVLAYAVLNLFAPTWARLIQPIEIIILAAFPLWLAILRFHKARSIKYWW